MTPLAIDLFTGLHGWAEGLEAEGYFTIGVDIVDMSAEIGEPKPSNFSLLIQDVRTLHGSQFKDAALIVASPPCQEYSYMAMPWTRAKAKAAAIRADTTGESLRRLNELFDACFRIQREASEAAGRHIPMVVENVKGAQPWVGRARWAFGSYFLWGDVPALMPMQRYHQRLKVSAGEQWNVNRANFTGTLGWDDGRKFNPDRIDHATKNTGGSWFKVAHNTTSGVGQNPDGRKVAGHDFSRFAKTGVKTPQWNTGSPGSPARKAASARIAKIPLALSQWIARTYLPQAQDRAA